MAEEEEMKGGDMDGDTPRGGNGRGNPCGGGLAPPQRKTWIYLTLPQNVRTCCCGNYMETFIATTMGRTYMGESRTTLYGSAVGAG